MNAILNKSRSLAIFMFQKLDYISTMDEIRTLISGDDMFLLAVDLMHSGQHLEASILTSQRGTLTIHSQKKQLFSLASGAILFPTIMRIQVIPMCRNPLNSHSVVEKL